MKDLQQVHRGRKPSLMGRLARRLSGRGVGEFLPSTDRHAVVFVHGFRGDHGTWVDFREVLGGSPELTAWDLYSWQYPTKRLVDVLGVWRADPGLEKLAIALSSKLRRPPLEKYRGVALLCHSMGGLIAQRALIDDETLRRRVSDLFMFGTPSNGLDNAKRLGFVKLQLEDMGTASKFITNLRDEWDAMRRDLSGRFRVWVVAGDQDQFVADSVLRPFRGEHGAACDENTHLEVVSGGHREMVRPKPGDDEDPVSIVVQALTTRKVSSSAGRAIRLAAETERFKEVTERYEYATATGATLDLSDLVKVALAYFASEKEDAAFKLLAEHESVIFVARRDRMAMDKFPERSRDLGGVLAGCLRRRWLNTGEKKDADRALALYKEGLEIAEDKDDPVQMLYYGINTAFMRSMLGYEGDARDLAEKVMEYCRQADERNLGRTVMKEATRAHARLILKESNLALQHYRAALGYGPTPREIDAMELFASNLAEKVGEGQVADRVAALFA